MIQPQELRIGNYVECLGDTKQVLDISKHFNQNETSRYYVGFKGIVPIKCMHLKPIPLTEQWLLDFGFKTKPSCNKDEYHVTLDDGWAYMCLDFEGGASIYACLDDFKNGSYACLEEKAIVKHVHQLQNLYFALTGEELKTDQKPKV